ncbi:MAG: hypothetical protein AAF889_12625 [Cyanobacteria bacterium P01_D01_bin.73]
MGHRWRSPQVQTDSRLSAQPSPPHKKKRPIYQLPLFPEAVPPPKLPLLLQGVQALGTGNG